MGGFATYDKGGGVPGTVVYADNVDFTGTGRTNTITTNGQLLIGSTAANAGGNHINVGTITSPNSTVTIGYSSPNITLTTGSTVATTYDTDSGSAIPSSGILNVLGGSNVTTSASGNTITIDATGGSNFEPNAVIQEFDDFLAGGYSASTISKLMWSYNVGASESFIPAVPTAGHPGIFESNNTGFNLDQALTLTNSIGGGATYTGPWKLGGGVLSMNLVVRLTSLSDGTNRYTYYAGISNYDADDAPAAPTDGIFFTYRDDLNSGNWVLNTIKASVTTTTNTAIPASTNFVNLGITVNAAGTSASFTIDGVAAGTIGTNIPIVDVSPFIMALITSGDTVGTQIDLFYCTQTLTTPR